LLQTGRLPRLSLALTLNPSMYGRMCVHSGYAILYISVNSVGSRPVPVPTNHKCYQMCSA